MQIWITTVCQIMYFALQTKKDEVYFICEQ